MKNFLLILFICFSWCGVIAQTDTVAIPAQADTTKISPPDSTQKTVKKRVLSNPVKKIVIADSLRVKDTLAPRESSIGSINENLPAPPSDTGKKLIAAPVIKRPIDSFYLKLLDNPYLKTNAKPIYLIINEREKKPKDDVFYLLLALLLVLAFIKLVFSRYFHSIFKLFFQPSFRQKQTREQLSQGNLPSLLLNLLFIFSTSIYISFLLKHYNFLDVNLWKMLLYSAAALTILYTGKFIFLTFTGWVFNVKNATDAYIFSVYLINKIIGVVLIPFILVIAFSQQRIINISITISILLVLLLFIYRYMLSYPRVRKEVKVSPLHFFLYVFSVEIIPLFLIYKTLITYLDKSL